MMNEDELLREEAAEQDAAIPADLIQEEVSEAVTLGRLAMALAAVDRQISRPDWHPESDTDHSVMVAWLACHLADRWYPGLDAGLVCQLAIVHDAVEAYAGDTDSLAADENRLRQQEQDEQAALRRIEGDLGTHSWLPSVIRLYEAQDLPEARFTWAVDKMVTKITEGIFTRGARSAVRVTAARRDAFRAREDRALRDKKIPQEFPQLYALYRELIRQGDSRRVQ